MRILKLSLKTLQSLVITLTVCTAAHAQNTGGVFGSTVKAGDRSVQYRLAVSPDGPGGETAIAQRIHYQQAINGEWRLRGVAQARKTADSDIDFDFFQAELAWQITPDGQDYQSGLRFDVAVRDESRPGQIGVNWINSLNLNDGWSVRGLILASVQAGNDARDGVFTQTRAHVKKKISDKASAGIEMFNFYGYSDDFGDFDDQRHSVGPFISAKATDNVSVFAGALFGVSDAATDRELRLWLGRSF